MIALRPLEKVKDFKCLSGQLNDDKSLKFEFKGRIFLWMFPSRALADDVPLPLSKFRMEQCILGTNEGKQLS